MTSCLKKKSSMASFRDWSNLPPELLVLIAGRIDSVTSFIAFARVCTSWRSAVTDDIFSPNSPHQIPWLMLSENQLLNNNDIREFYDIRVRVIRKTVLPEASRRRCLSSLGWLFVVEENGIEASLVNPFSRVKIRLPNLNTFPDYGTYDGQNMVTWHAIDKVLLSAQPILTPDFLVIISWGLNKLGFCRVGDDSWTELDRWNEATYDIIWYEGKLYGVDANGRVFVCDINGPSPTSLDIFRAMRVKFVPKIERLYLVESLGKLLVVSRSGVWPHPVKKKKGGKPKETYETNEFRVFELSTRNEIKDLGNRALFLGYNSSFSVEACAKVGGCKANCIYFTDDAPQSYFNGNHRRITGNGGGKDMGIYNLLDGSFEPFFNGESCSRITPPQWVEPSFFWNALPH